MYGRFISNYSGDDIDKKLSTMIKIIVMITADSYRAAYFDGITTSLNYYFKSDTQYTERILSTFINHLSMTFGTEIKISMDIFKRSQS